VDNDALCLVYHLCLISHNPLNLYLFFRLFAPSGICSMQSLGDFTISELTVVLDQIETDVKKHLERIDIDAMMEICQRAGPARTRET
jgi:hypothetical protein